MRAREFVQLSYNFFSQTTDFRYAFNNTSGENGRYVMARGRELVGGGGGERRSHIKTVRSARRKFWQEHLRRIRIFFCGRCLKFVSSLSVINANSSNNMKWNLVRTELFKGTFLKQFLFYGITYPKGLRLILLTCHASREAAETFINVTTLILTTQMLLDRHSSHLMLVVTPFQTTWWYSWEFLLSKFEINACTWMNNIKMDLKNARPS